MKNNNLSEILISIILVILLTLLLDPLGFVMATSLQMMVILFILIIFIAFSVFVWKEKPKDEREELHNHVTSRFAYLSGITILVVALIYQSLTYTLDPWIIIALIVMILAKVIGSIYTKNKL